MARHPRVPSGPRVDPPPRSSSPATATPSTRSARTRSAPRCCSPAPRTSLSVCGTYGPPPASQFSPATPVTATRSSASYVARGTHTRSPTPSRPPPRQDVHLSGDRFASSGMDNTVRVWSLQEPSVVAAIEESECWSEPEEVDVDPGRGMPQGAAPAASAASSSSSSSSAAVVRRVEERKQERAPFHTRLSQLPVFTTRRVHSDYVDAVLWLGDALVSKSTEGRVVVWKPDLRYARDGVCVLQTFTLPESSIWFVRHALSEDLSRLACGARVRRMGGALSTPPHTHTLTLSLSRWRRRQSRGDCARVGHAWPRVQARLRAQARAVQGARAPRSVQPRQRVRWASGEGQSAWALTPRSCHAQHPACSVG